MTPSRRAFLGSTLLLSRLRAAPTLRVTAFDLIPVRATERTVWLILRLSTDQGPTGLGECSDAFGFANTTKQDATRMESELGAFFELIHGKSPLDIEAFRQKAWPRASSGLIAATAFSAIEQALWDLSGHALNIPVYNFFGGKVRDRLPVYANINRATTNRKPEGFAETAKRAVADGFRAIKGAPWDGFPKTSVDQGIACAAAMRSAVGPEIEIMVDCHSFFDVPLAQSVAHRLEPYNLAWYEEPVPPERTEETLAIHKAIRQPMAGGEILFGMKGFEPLCRNQAVNVIMPDVKHCGGLLEITHIAAMARTCNVAVAPHNPSGPISTAANVQICAGMANFRLLELQWGEVSWRSGLISPPERFEHGRIEVPDRPGLGIQLNESLARAHPI